MLTVEEATLFGTPQTSQMGICQGSDFSAARRALYEALLYQERLVHLFQRARVLVKKRKTTGSPPAAFLLSSMSENQNIYLVDNRILFALKKFFSILIYRNFKCI